MAQDRHPRIDLESVTQSLIELLRLAARYEVGSRIPDLESNPTWRADGQLLKDVSELVTERLLETPVQRSPDDPTAKQADADLALRAAKLAEHLPSRQNKRDDITLSVLMQHMRDVGCDVPETFRLVLRRHLDDMAKRSRAEQSDTQLLEELRDEHIEDPVISQEWCAGRGGPIECARLLCGLVHLGSQSQRHIMSVQKRTGIAGEHAEDVHEAHFNRLGYSDRQALGFLVHQYFPANVDRDDIARRVLHELSLHRQALSDAESGRIGGRARDTKAD